MSVVVHTQAELDAALAVGTGKVYIDAPKAVALVVSGTKDCWVEVRGESTIQRVWGSATIQSVGGSATAHLHDHAKLLKAGPHTTAYIHSAHVTFDDGGHVIDLTELDLTDGATWCDFNGVDIDDGKAVLFKATDADLVAGQEYRPTTYPPGTTVTAPDWDPVAECGNGLHLCADPAATLAYRDGAGVRYLACEVEVASIVGLGDKVKVPALRVLHEVDMGGRPLTAGPVTSGAVSA